MALLLAGVGARGVQLCLQPSERTIETGMSNWDWTEVTSGLKTGDLVVTSVDRDGIEDGALAQQEAEEKQP